MPQYVWIGRTKNQILDVGYDNNGKKYKRKVKFRPSCYIESNNPNCDIRTIYGQATQKIEFDSIQDYQKYVSTHKTIAQGTIDPCIQYIHENYSNNDLNIKLRVLFFDIEVYSDTGEFPHPEHTKYPVNSCSFYSTQTNRYYLLSLKDYDKTKNTIGIDSTKIKFKKCENEYELLDSIIKIIQYEFCDILSGWNSSQFDIPYLLNRMGKILGRDKTNNISPFGKYFVKQIKKKNRVTQNYEDYFICDIDGIILLDYMELYKKYILDPRESYSLDFIAHTELGEGKVDYSAFDNLSDLWQKSPQLYSDYNIVDTDLLKSLEERLTLIELNSIISYGSKCNHTDSLGSIKMWESYLYNEMFKNKICLPIRNSYDKEEYPGAFVVDTIPGYYENIVTFDLESLYPSIIIQNNISTETMCDKESFKKLSLHKVKNNELLSKYLMNDYDEEINKINVDYLVENTISNELKQLLKITNHSLTPNQYFWNCDKRCIISNILRNLFDDRKKIKNSMLDIERELQLNKDETNQNERNRLNNIQKAIKTRMNSYYGITGNRFFVFYHIEVAKAITLSAQLASKYIEKYVLNHDTLKKFNIGCITGDTDSRFFHLDNIIQTLVRNKKIEDVVEEKIKFMNKFSIERIQPVIVEGYDKISDDFNAIEKRLVMKLEKTCSSGIFLAKKHYALNVYSNEGVVYSNPKLKATGIELVKASTPASIKPYLKNILVKILNKDDIVKYVKECKRDFLKLDCEKIAFSKSANNFDKWFSENQMKPGIPIGVRAAITFNQFIDKHNLESQFAKIKSGDKIKFLYMKMPNIVGQDVCGFLRRFPKELHKYVDKEMMWEKSFMAVVRSMCEKIGIEYEESKSINGLF